MNDLNESLLLHVKVVLRLTAETIFVSTTRLNGTKNYAFDVKNFKRDKNQRALRI